MPNINTSVDDLFLKSDRRFDFTNGSSKPVPLTTDPIETSPNISYDSHVCADSLNETDHKFRGRIFTKTTIRFSVFESIYKTNKKI
ncbi:hypothetical protein R6Q57_021377 [Mikania cordata]